MPQINRIRVNNVRYNFGTQFYDDFVMRFSCRNTIYDLENGGGKSVLMLLLMQNMIPNCTLDEKQPVEKLFRGPGASTTIHSLIEWKLDECDMHDGYRYMTTGFCARKAHENEAVSENGDETDSGIEYFNYCIFYKEYGPDDIKNLPLVSDGERITYNGLKAYLRDLGKKNPRVEVRIFDRKRDYQSFISRYGIYESQWEIIRGINKTEGHVRAYFENSYKTTRKVVEDLLIEEIIEKSYNNRIHSESTDSTDMACTLLDIRDRLTELMKRKSERDSYTKQVSLLTDFSQKAGEFLKLYSDKARVEGILTDCYALCRMKLSEKTQRITALQKEYEELLKAYGEAQKMTALAEIEEEYCELKKTADLIGDTEKDRKAAEETEAKLESRLKEYEIAENYEDYRSYRKKYEETRFLLNSSSEGSDAAKRLSSLAAAKAVFYEKKKKALSEKMDELKALSEELTAVCDETGELRQKIFGRISGLESLSEDISRRNSEYAEELGTYLSQCGMLVADGIDVKAAENVDKLNAAQKSLENYRRLIDESDTRERIIEREITECRAVCEQNKQRLTELNAELAESENQEKIIQRMSGIYGGTGASDTLDIMEGMLTAIESDRISLEKERSDLSAYSENIKNHRLPDGDADMKHLLAYLKEHYNDVLSGKEYLESMSPEEALKAVNNLPILPYAIIAGESYEQIAADEVIHSSDTGLHVIPIIPVNYESTDNSMVHAYRELSFLWDDAALNTELMKVSDEIDAVSEKIRRLSDKEDTVREDILNIRIIMRGEKTGNIKEKIDELENSISRSEENIATLTGGLRDAQDRHADYLEKADETEKSLKDAQKVAEVYDSIINIKAAADALNEQYIQVRNDLAQKKKEYREAGEKTDDVRRKLSDCRLRLESMTAELSEAESDFNSNFRPYIDSNTDAADGMSEEEIDIEAAALRKIIMGQTKDVNERRKLLSEYEMAMKKCEQKLKYYGISVSGAQELYDEGKLVTCSVSDMMALRDEIKKAGSYTAEIDSRLDAQNARKNRIEGGIDHEIRKFTEHYGEFERMSFDNPADSVLRYRQEMSSIKEKNEVIRSEIKKTEDDNRDVILMERDLERILKNAGIDLPDEAYVPADRDFDVGSVYKSSQNDYAGILRRENSMRGEFIKDRQTLADELDRCRAFELAGEIRENVNVPENEEDVRKLTDGIKDTCQCIILERDRVDKSMKDMEQIKESFENRCLQICSNIKTELDRLPGLSRITLDDKAIPVVTLSIPYVKEEMYRERMSLYIDDTVAGAETFENREDKLKYIRNRLSWKKLFSVIVTDMNGIKLCLYKREHLKEQSRYLRYEEAVGSTGQSQGMYIQFLIAVINYIANINSLGKDASVTGKTVFIDNPFGAAKDVYIWEPVFKMLRTNHVQLIVPARGVTPAITKLFDVNYVLGQKISGGRQQTVVTDYRSQVDTDDMEYAPLEYHQGTFDFEHML